jgi:molybdopterin/thiamine biosynthesis adenylyltransferase
MDKVSACGRRIRRLRPGAAVRVWATPIEQLGPARLAGTRLVICATDSFRSRLWVAEAATCVGVPVLDVALDGTGQSLFARIALYDPAHGTACLACGWDEASWQAVQEETSASGCAALLGTGADPAPTLALPGLAEAVAGIAVVQAVRLLLGVETERVSGCEWRLNLTAGRLDVSRPRRDPRCRLDHERWPARMLPKPPAALRLDELFAVASESVGEPVRLRVFGTALVGAAACPSCRQEFRVGRLERALPPCPQCGGKLVPLARATATSFARTDAAAFVEKSLEAIDVHAGDLVMASGPEGSVAFGFTEVPSACL